MYKCHLGQLISNFLFFFHFSDVTLNDYANSNAGAGQSRVKKGVCNTLVRTGESVSSGFPPKSGQLTIIHLKKKSLFLWKKI